MTSTFDRLGYGTYKLADGVECAAGVVSEIDPTDDRIARIDALDRGEGVVDFEEAPWNRA